MHTLARTKAPADPHTLNPADQSTKLTSDCSQCTALCCIALGFFAEQGFGFDKAAHTPCPHLNADFKCAIHAERAAAGFRGCIVYDCHGAGQRVTRAFHLKQALSRPQHETRRVIELFRRVQTLHEMMALLHTAIPHLQDATQAHNFAALLADIDAQCARLLAGADIDSAAIQQQVRTALESLQAQTGVLQSLRDS